MISKGKIEITEDRKKYIRKALMLSAKIIFKEGSYCGFTISVPSGMELGYMPKICLTFKLGSGSVNVVCDNLEQVKELLKGFMEHVEDNEGSVNEVLMNEQRKYEGRREQELITELQGIQEKREKESLRIKQKALN